MTAEVQMNITTFYSFFNFLKTFKIVVHCCGFNLANGSDFVIVLFNFYFDVYFYENYRRKPFLKKIIESFLIIFLKLFFKSKKPFRLCETHLAWKKRVRNHTRRIICMKLISFRCFFMIINCFLRKTYMCRAL